MDENEDDTSGPDLGDDEDVDEHVPEESEEDEDEFNEDEEMLDEDEDLGRQQQMSLVVKLSVNTSKLKSILRGYGMLSPQSETKGSHRDGSPTVNLVPVVQMAEATGTGRQDVDAAKSATITHRQQTTPEPEIVAATGIHQPATPSGGLTSAPLAFRGSPEKPQSMGRPIGISYQH
jgi:hypothetical protein